jgi:hypothetical protein
MIEEMIILSLAFMLFVFSLTTLTLIILKKILENDK